MKPGEQYSPDQFYTRSSDDHGHSVSLRVNLPKQHGALLNTLRELYPNYRSHSDVVRDALLHRWRYLFQNSETILNEEQSASLRMVLMSQRMEQMAELDATCTQLEKQIDDTIVRLVEQKQFQKLYNFCDEQIGVVDGLEDPYRGRILKKLKTAYRRCKSILEKRAKKRKSGAG